MSATVTIRHYFLRFHLRHAFIDAAAFAFAVISAPSFSLLDERRRLHTPESLR